MMTKEEFQALWQNRPVLLDGATGSNLQKAGMPRGCCTEAWVLAHPGVILELQERYVEAGTEILYAPTFQAQPIALQKEGLENHTEKINADLVALSRKAAQGQALVAGDLTTLAAFTDSWDPEKFDLLVENYRRQIRGLVDGGADLLIGETLLYPQEGEAILTAAELECVPVTMLSYTMQSDGALYSGMDGVGVLRELEGNGASAVGFNCVAADSMTAGLVSRIRRQCKAPILCKPNAGMPVIGDDGLPHYPMAPEEFGGILAQCRQNGASLLGGCCGTTPDFIRKAKPFLT